MIDWRLGYGHSQGVMGEFLTLFDALDADWLSDGWSIIVHA